MREAFEESRGWWTLSVSQAEALKLSNLPGVSVAAVRQNWWARGRIDGIAACCRILGLPHPASPLPTLKVPQSDKLRHYQLEGVARLTGIIKAHGGAMLADEMGLGKGLCYATRVLTPTGWTTASQVRKGNLLVGRDGKPTKVLGVYHQGPRPVFEITFSDGTMVKADDQHLWSVQTANDAFRAPSRWQTLTTQELAKEPARKWRIPLLTQPAQLKDVWVPLHPYLLGVLLGDGSLAHHAPEIHINNDDKKEIRHQVLMCLPDGDFLGPRALPTVVGISGGRTREALRSLGLWGTSAETKFVPSAYLIGSALQRLALLQGLMDTDGWCSGGCTQFGSASVRLRDAVVELVQSLGGVARRGLKAEPKFKYKGKVKTGLPCYLATISMPPGINPFRVRAHLNRPKTKYLPARMIVSVKKLPEKEETVCFKVEATDSLFVMDHYVVTHNTRQAIVTADLLKARPVLIIARASVRETWREEFLKWGIPAEKVAVLGPPSDQRYDTDWARLGKAEWVVCSYALLDKLVEARFQWQSPGVLIVDEMHEVKARKRVKRADDVEYLARLAPYKLGISGTPFDNVPADLFRVMSILLGGNRFGTYSQFTTRYCNGRHEGHGWKADGVTEGDELKTRLAYYMVRREKLEVAKELPTKTRQVRWVEADAAAIRAFQRLSLGMGSVSDALLAALDCKIPAAIEAAQEAGKFLLLTWTRKHAEQMAETLKVPFIHGGLTTEKRSAIVKDCAAKGLGVVATADSVGVGVDGLQHVASIGIMHSFDWRPLLMAQREDRLHRLGQTANVHWLYLAARDTVDEPVVKRLVKKLDAFREVIGKTEDARGLRDALAVDPEMEDEGAYMNALIEEMRARRGEDG